MTELRQKMIKAMELRNLSKQTQRGYLMAVKGLAQHYHQSPDKLTKEMIEDYLLYLKNEKRYTPGSCAAVVSGLRFFYNNIADKPITIDYSVPDKGCKLPTVLTQKEVWNIICAPKNIKHRLILMTTYSAGLRAAEVAALKHKHIESEKMLIKVEGGKGRKDRYTMLSVKLLAELRHYYKKCRLKTYLFPSSFKKKKDKPLSYETVRSIYEKCRVVSGSDRCYNGGRVNCYGVD